MSNWNQDDPVVVRQTQFETKVVVDIACLLIIDRQADVCYLTIRWQSATLLITS